LYFQRRYQAAVEQYEASLSGFEAVGAELEAAITRSSAIGSLSHLARYERALDWTDSARQTFERHQDLVHLARLEVAVGHIHSRQDRFSEAIGHYERARDLFDGDIGEPVDVASTLRNIAVCYQDLNDFHGSLLAYREARDYCREHGVPLIGLEVEYNIAYIYYLRGEYSRAIHQFEEARRQSREHDDPHHAALCDLDLSEIFLELNLVEDARDLAERAREAFQQLGMDYETGKAMAYQAMAAARLGERRGALSLLTGARQIFNRQGNRAWVAMVDLYEALTLFADGRMKEAARFAEAAVTGFSETGAPSRRAASEVVRARLALRLGDLDAARQSVQAALELAGEAGRPQLEFQGHLTAAQIAEVDGDPAGALDSYVRAHRTLERLRGELHTDELQIAFADDKQAAYEGLVAVRLAVDQTPDGLEAAFLDVETAKSRGLSDLLSLGSAAGRRRRSEADPAPQETRELRRELNWRYRQLGIEELRGGEAGLERRRRLRDEVRTLERRMLRHLRGGHATGSELPQSPDTPVLDLGRLRTTLPEDSTLIEFFIARGVLYRFRLDRAGLAVDAIGDLDRLRELHRQLQFQFGKFRVGSDYVERFERMFYGQALAILEELHEVLLGGWQPSQEVRHLIVVPHAFLHHVPFHALYDGARFLIDRYTVSYAPSATVFQLCSQRQSISDGHSLILGVPDERAPKILDEVRAVAEILPDNRLLVAKAATREALARYGDGCRFLHLATHGLHRRDNPMFSALQLGDDRMSLLDLYDLELGVDLAVLSGCGTGLSDVRGFDELVGLTRGLLFAGARSVVATLWDVNDDSTAELMRHFYRRLMERPEPAAALRDAMLAVRQTHPHPYYWAPFVLTGHYRAL
jgi:tetratricopeptide (TPR) repeat protein